MRPKLFNLSSLLTSMVMVGILGAICSPSPGSSAVSNPRCGAYRGYISRSGKPRGIYKKRGLSSSARRRSIAGVKKVRRKNRGK